MSAWRRARAALVLGLVSGVFWAAVLPIVAAVLITTMGTWSASGVLGSLGLVALVGAIAGFAGGALYAGLLAGLGRRDDTARLTLGRAAIAGGIAGAGLYVAFVVAFAPLFGATVLFTLSSLVSTALYAALGAGTGTLLMWIARRGKALPSGWTSSAAVPTDDSHR